MALRSAGRQLFGLQLPQAASQSAGTLPCRRWCSSNAGAARPKRADQMNDEELKQALPSMLFTTSNLIWSTTLAVGVAAGGLLAMFWVGTFITGAAKSLKHLEEPAAAAAPPPQKSLAELIEDRKVELQAQLEQLQQQPRTQETKQAAAAARRELRQYGVSTGAWWSWW
ncbi:hypothetical protein OEZ85_001845 [Tetradesmus obliquus]|uniref:Uncharacterized protein n=1 Tax=Tetradesmus obliquus TaxID=3088 RepID=A0ABY8U137_TETOB|nr:hypothetical protein OEZ85_001845 [Tetradesmus obliquus]